MSLNCSYTNLVYGSLMVILPYRLSVVDYNDILDTKHTELFSLQK